METSTSSLTKNEHFAWSDGCRIVDLFELSKQLHCKQCSSVLDLQCTEREIRYGLASVLYIYCSCGLVNDVHTCKIQPTGADNNSTSSSPVFEVNVKASINLLLCGEGSSRILNFLALLDIPVPSSHDAFLTTSPLAHPEALHTPIAFQRAVSTSLSTSIQPSVPLSQISISSVQKSMSFSSSSRTDLVPEFGNIDSDGQIVYNVEVVDYHSDNDDVGKEEKGDDSDYDYIPVQFKPKGRSKGVSAVKKKAVQKPRKSAQAKSKPAAKKASPRVSKLTTVKNNENEALKDSENFDVSKEKSAKNQSKENSINNIDLMGWSSTESENESFKDRDSDGSWQQEELNNSETDQETKPKRKKGRPKGPVTKAKKSKMELKSYRTETGGCEGEDREVPRCDECDKVFNSVKGYNVHMKRVHNQDMKVQSEVGEEEKVKGYVYVCPECHKPCGQRSNMVYHFSRAHHKHVTDVTPYAVSLENVVLKLKRTDGCQQFRCLKCDNILLSRYKMSQHLCIDTNGAVTCKTLCPDGLGFNSTQRQVFLKSSPQFLCHTCGNSFKSRSNYKIHALSHSKELKELVCEHCPYTTTIPAYITAHVLRKHSVGTPHVCDICGRVFKQQKALRQHKQRIHEKKEFNFPCQYCPKVFCQQQTLTKHEWTHSGKRPWVCKTCGQAFNKNYNLKVHERIHSGDKPYGCKQCGAAFAQKNSLNVHMKKHAEERDVCKMFHGKKFSPNEHIAEEMKYCPPASEDHESPLLNDPGFLSPQEFSFEAKFET